MLRTNPGLREVSPTGNNSAVCGFRDMGPVEFSPTVPESQTIAHGLPTTVSGLPTIVPGFPTIVPVFPTIVPGFPTTVPGFPTIVPGFPTIVPGFPTIVPGFPTIVRGFRHTLHGVPKSSPSPKTIRCPNRLPRRGYFPQPRVAASAATLGDGPATTACTLSGFLCARPDGRSIGHHGPRSSKAILTG